MDHQAEVCLVPLDGSEFSRLALLAASELAERLGMDVHLLSAVSSTNEVPVRHRQLARIRVGERDPSISVVVNQDPAGVIHEELEHLRTAVVCLASHGRHRASLLRHSVTDQVIAREHDAVLVTGPLVGRPKGSWWSDDDLSLARFRGGGVVACLGASERADSLMSHAVAWAAQLGEAVIALTVAEAVSPLLSDGRDRIFGPAGDVDSFLASATGAYGGAGVEVVKKPIYESFGPGEGVCDYLEDSPAALVVIGAHRRSQPSGAELRGTAAAIVRRSPSPVLVVP
jgi:nucleotide-binding universal stress UspA family protein